MKINLKILIITTAITSLVDCGGSSTNIGTVGATTAYFGDKATIK